MKIGIDIRTLMDRKYSGVAEHTLNLVREILKLDQKNEYKLFYNSFKDVKDNLPKFFSQNVEIIKTNYPNKVFNYCLQKIWHQPKIDKILGGVDVFLSPHINFTSLTKNCKHILVIHDLSFLRYPEFFNFRKKIWHGLVNVKRLMAQADKIIAISDNTKNDIIDLGKVSEDKIKVIYPGADKNYRVISPFDIKREAVKKKYDLPDKFILSLSTLEPRKNLVGLIKAYEKFRHDCPELASTQLVLAGGVGWRAGKIFQAWRKSEFKNDIKLLGYVDNQDKPYLYNLASVFVYASFYEGFGLPLLEAMACGVPIITSYSSSLAEVVGKSALLIDPYNIKEIAHSLGALLRDKNLSQKLSLAGSNQATKFSWTKTANSYLNIFLE